MPYSPGRSGHRALKALAESPRTPDELRDIINPNRKGMSVSKIVSMRRDGLIWAGREEFLITDLGREALTILNGGEPYDAVRQSVRLFIGSQGGAGANNLRAEG